MPSKKRSGIDWNSFSEFVNEFRSESDRASVILGVAKLDLVMYQIIQAVLLPSPSGTDELLDGDSPLSTFSAKINFLHRLGLIDAGFSRALHMIRKTRNAFAHEVSGCNLNSGAHSDRVRDLIRPIKHLPFVQDFQDHFFPKSSGAGVDFRTVLAIMVGRLEAILASVEPVNLGVVNSLVLPGWDTENYGVETEPDA